MNNIEKAFEAWIDTAPMAHLDDTAHPLPLTWTAGWTAGQAEFQIKNELQNLRLEHYQSMYQVMTKLIEIQSAQLAEMKNQHVQPIRDKIMQQELDKSKEQTREQMVLVNMRSDQVGELLKTVFELKAQLADAQSVPSGWQLVPIVSTRAMDQVGYDALNSYAHLDDAMVCWTAMITASPTPK